MGAEIAIPSSFWTPLALVSHGSQELRISQLQRRPEWTTRLIAPPPELRLEQVLHSLERRGYEVLGLSRHPRRQRFSGSPLALVAWGHHAVAMALYERMRQRRGQATVGRQVLRSPWTLTSCGRRGAHKAFCAAEK